MGSARTKQHERVIELLRSSLVSQCRYGLGLHAGGFNVEALIGITLHDGDVMLISLKETVEENDDSPFPDFPGSDDPGETDDQIFTPTKRLLPLRKRKRGKPRKISRNSLAMKQTIMALMDKSITTFRQTETETKAIGLPDASDVIGGAAEKIMGRCENIPGVTMVTDGNASDHGVHQPIVENVTGIYSRVHSEADLTGLNIPQIGPYSCSQCAVVYKYRKCLVEHYTKCHQGPVKEEPPKPTSWPCGACERVFPSKRSLIRHSVIHGQDKKPHRCETCKKTFTCKRHVEFHISTVHKGNYPYVCDQCGKQVTTRAALDCHLAAKHQINILKCERCQREYARPEALANHQCVAKPIKNEDTTCQVCNKTFDQPKQLIQHQAKHLDPKYQCDLCGRNFKWLSSLQAHKTAAHPDTDVTSQLRGPEQTTHPGQPLDQSQGHSQELVMDLDQIQGHAYSNDPNTGQGYDQGQGHGYDKVQTYDQGHAESQMEPPAYGSDQGFILPHSLSNSLPHHGLNSLPPPILVLTNDLRGYTGQDVTHLTHPGQDVTQLAHPRQDVTQLTHPGQDVTQLSHPGQDVTQLAITGQDVTQLPHPGQDVTQLTHPGQDVTQLSQDVTAIHHPTTEFTTTQLDNQLQGVSVSSLQHHLLDITSLHTSAVDPTSAAVGVINIPGLTVSAGPTEQEVQAAWQAFISQGLTQQ